MEPYRDESLEDKWERNRNTVYFRKGGNKKNIQGREKTRFILKFKKTVETFATLEG